MKHNTNFNFWLDFFAEIMPNIEILLGKMQSRSMNSAIADAAIGCFTTAIQKTCDEVGSPYSICPPDESVGDPTDDEEA